MKKKNSYNSQKYKTFKQAVIQLIEKEFAILGSGQVLNLLIDNIMVLIEEYMPERVIPGKVTISAISKNAPKGHQRGVKSLPQVPVSIDIVNADIIEKYMNNEKVRDIKRECVIQMFNQAYEQGGVLSGADVAVLLKMSSATISKYVRDYMEMTNKIVPTRGFIHDIGPSISHKGIIVGKFLNGQIPDKIARTTNHSQKAVDRYIKDYERIKLWKE